jgi:hypothetical protein
MTAPRRIGRPAPVAVQTGRDGAPACVGRLHVEHVLEDWLVEDRWWTGRPVRRRYFELVTTDGRCIAVFRDLVGGRWFQQRG